MSLTKRYFNSKQKVCKLFFIMASSSLCTQNALQIQYASGSSLQKFQMAGDANEMTSADG
jgi:hypothetical protein